MLISEPQRIGPIPFDVQEKEEWMARIDKQMPPQIVANQLRRSVYAISSVCTLGILPLIRRKLANLVSNLIVPALINSTVGMKKENQQRKRFFQESYVEKCKEFDLHVNRTATINGMTLFLSEAEKKAFEQQQSAEQKWIVYFNGNGAFYEWALEQSQQLAEDCQANMLVFNYRGVGESRGQVTQPEDLIQDGEACIQYLLSKGVREENIVIYGHSLGGGVGTQVAKMHEKVGLINDRSFGSLSAAIHTITKSRLLAYLAVSLGWELDSVQAFEEMKNKKLIVWHKEDGVISYHKSALYKALKERIKTSNPSSAEESAHKGMLKKRLKAQYKPQGVKLQRKIAEWERYEAHNYEVCADTAFPKIQAFVRGFFIQF